MCVQVHTYMCVCACAWFRLMNRATEFEVKPPKIFAAYIYFCYIQHMPHALTSLALLSTCIGLKPLRLYMYSRPLNPK